MGFLRRSRLFVYFDSARLVSSPKGRLYYLEGVIDPNDQQAEISSFTSNTDTAYSYTRGVRKPQQKRITQHNQPRISDDGSTFCSTGFSLFSPEELVFLREGFEVQLLLPEETPSVDLVIRFTLHCCEYSPDGRPDYAWESVFENVARFHVVLDGFQVSCLPLLFHQSTQLVCMQSVAFQLDSEVFFDGIQPIDLVFFPDRSDEKGCFDAYSKFCANLESRYQRITGQYREFVTTFTSKYLAPDTLTINSKFSDKNIVVPPVLSAGAKLVQYTSSVIRWLCYYNSMLMFHWASLILTLARYSWDLYHFLFPSYFDDVAGKWTASFLQETTDLYEVNSSEAIYRSHMEQAKALLSSRPRLASLPAQPSSSVAFVQTDSFLPPTDSDGIVIFKEVRAACSGGLHSNSEEGRLARRGRKGMASSYTIKHPTLNPESETVFLKCKGCESINNKENTYCRKCFHLLDPLVYKNLHVVIYIHGFGANYLSMSDVRNCLSFYNPMMSVIMVSTISETTDQGIQVNAKKVAAEVASKLERICGGTPSLIAKVSVIAHSLGGLIIREALLEPPLAPYLRKLENFVSFSTPHLGLKDGGMLTEYAFSLLKRFKDSTTLHELDFTDAETVEKCLIYQMSEKPVLAVFKRLIFVSCLQDTFVPYSSARVQLSNELSSSKNSTLFRKMADSLLLSLPPESVLRYDLHFTISDTSVDTISGRRGHILPINSFYAIVQLLSDIKQFF